MKKKKVKKDNTLRNRFKKFKGANNISKKIISAIMSISVVASLTIGLAGIIALVAINVSTEQSYKDNVTVLSPLYKVQYDFMQVRLNLSAMAQSTSPDKSDYITTISEMTNAMTNQLDKYGASLPAGKAKENYKTIREDIQVYVSGITTAEGYIKDGRIDEFNAMESGSNATRSKIIENAIDKAFALNTSLAKENNERSTRIFYIALAVIIVCIFATVLVSIKRGRKISKTITVPINKMVDAANSIASGDLSVDLWENSRDEIGTLALAFQKIVTALQLLKTDVNMLVGEALEGRLDTRADLTQHEGDYREIIEGVNKTLDTVKAPLDVASDYIGKLADGERQENIENTYQGYYAVLIDNLNKVRDSIHVLIDETGKLAEAGREGDLEYRGDESRISGFYTDIIHGVNDTFDSIKAPLDAASEFISNLASGTHQDNMENNYSGYYAQLIDNLNTVREAVESMFGESQKLVQAGLEGDLTVRGDISRLSGVYQMIIDGFNQTLESIVVPLNEARDVLGKLAINDYKAKMSDQYNGMLQELSYSINDVRDRLLSVEFIFVNVGNGDISQLEELRETGKLSENDKLMPATVAMMQSIQDLIDESNKLAAAAYAGDLSVRSDTDKFPGGYRQIIEGMNKTMEAVSAPIEESSQILGEVALGNLTVEMTGTYNGEYNKIKDSLNDAVTSFNELISAIKDAATQVLAGSRQVSDASQSLSQGAAEQASSVEELTSSITEVAAQTRKNASNATQASDLTATVKSEAAQGNEKMAEMLNSMLEINDSSSNISKIIKAIDDIAFQTNILALNAAVEAARAGQYGKGFAVVAEEVRNLAGKSAQAAKETAELIEGSVKKVEAGTKIANETADVLGKIVDSAQKSASIVNEIADASNEQATSIAQIDQGVMQVSTVVQTNSATSEESAASSEELTGQANMLMEMVSKFKLKNDAADKKADQVSAGKQKNAVSNSTGVPAKNSAKSKITLNGEFGKY